MQKLAFKIADTDAAEADPRVLHLGRTEQADNRGPVTDLWDKGIDFPKRNDDGTFWERNIPSFMAGRTLSWVMLLVVGLLCWEWLTRKLLRLA